MTQQTTQTALIKSKVRRYMRTSIEDHTGNFGIPWEVNTTQLAEDAAYAIAPQVGQDPINWLDDETHFVWDIAVEEGKHYEEAAMRDTALPAHVDNRQSIEDMLELTTKGQLTDDTDNP